MIDTMKRVLKESNLRRYTQRELKNLIATGQAIDLDTLPTDTNLRNNLRKLGYATSTYGLGGGLWSDTTTGEWYAIVGRSPKLFFYESKQRTPLKESFGKNKESKIFIVAYNYEDGDGNDNKELTMEELKGLLEAYNINIEEYNSKYDTDIQYISTTYETDYTIEEINTLLSEEGTIYIAVNIEDAYNYTYGYISTEVEVEHVSHNFDPEVREYDEDEYGAYVRIIDRNSNFDEWITIELREGDVITEWSDWIFGTGLDDTFRYETMLDGWIYDLATSTALAEAKERGYVRQTDTGWAAGENYVTIDESEKTESSPSNQNSRYFKENIDSTQESKQRTPINRSNSFIIDGKLVATADYEKDAYVFRDVTNRIVKRVKSDKLRLPKDNAKAWDKLRKTFGENKTLLENAVEGDQVILVEEDYDNMSAFELFILDDDFILAHGSDTRNTMYPWDEALQEFIKDNNLDIREYLHPETITELEQELDEYLNRLGLDIDKLNQSKREEMLIDDALYHVDELYITELEEVVENNGFVITSTPGYSQGDHYAIVTEGPYDKDFLTDVVFNTNFYKISLCEFKNYENELGENILDLDYIDTRWSTHLGYPIDTKTLEEMVLDLWGSPKYYKVDISSTYSASQIIEKLESMGLVEYIEPEIEYLD